MHLHGRTIGWFAHPQVEVLPFSRLKEEDVVAIIEISKFVQLIELRFRIQLGVFSTMGEKRMEVIHEVSVPIGDTAGAEN